MRESSLINQNFFIITILIYVREFFDASRKSFLSRDFTLFMKHEHYKAKSEQSRSNRGEVQLFNKLANRDPFRARTSDLYFN